MRRINGYQEATTYSDSERLPVGGYVLKILDAKEQKNSWGDVLVISFDIAEGEQKDFFAKNYRAQTGEDKKWKGVYRLRIPVDDGSEDDEPRQIKFKTVMKRIEGSNPGFHWDWDERTLKGKLIGALFNNKEYDFDGRHGFFTNCHSLVTTEKIRSGKFEIPADTLLKSNASQNYGTPSSVGDGFMNIPDDVNDEALPFN